MRTLFPLLALLALLLASPLKADDSWMLYDDSEVARIDVDVDPAAIAFMYANVYSDSLHPCTVRFRNALLDETLEDVGIRLRGNTSRAAAKKSFKLSFNSFVPGRQFRDVDKLNLNGEHNDPSIVRSKLCWDLHQRIGTLAPRAAHARLYLNGDYFGLYVSVEHVDDEFLENRLADSEGNLWKCLWPADLAWLGSDPDLYKFSANDHRTYELETNEELDDYSALARLIGVLHDTPQEQLADSLEGLLAVTDVLKALAVDVLTGGWDDYWFLKNNYYLYHEPAGDRFRFIPYDTDNTFGIDWFGRDWSTVDVYDFGSSEPRPLVDRLFADGSIRNLFTHVLDVVGDNAYALPLWEARLDSLKERIAPWAEADSFRTLDYGFTMDDFHDSYTAGTYLNQHVKRGLKAFVNRRNQSLGGQLEWLAAPPFVYALRQDPPAPAAGDSVRIDCSAFGAAGLAGLTIRWHPQDGPDFVEFPMEPAPVAGSPLVEECDRWSGTLPPLGPGAAGSYEILATGADGRVQLHPRTARVPLATPSADVPWLRLNELMSDNGATIADPQGEFEDWVEILNAGDEAVALGGLRLSDSFAEPAKWIFPDTTLAAGGRLLVWCDNDGGDGGLHAAFKLSASGEELILSTATGAVLDSLSFGACLEDWSWQVACDAAGPGPGDPSLWTPTADPTPGSPNGGCPEAVGDLRIAVSGGHAILEWDGGTGASWIVYRLASPWAGLVGAEELGTVTQPSFTHENALSAGSGYYAVTASTTR